MTANAIILVAFFLAGCGLVLGLARLARPIELAIGFAGIAAIWAFGYVALTAPGLAAGEVLFGAMLAAVAAAHLQLNLGALRAADLQHGLLDRPALGILAVEIGRAHV